MKCKWLSDEFNAVCTNDKCPACADFCPCVNYQEICKYAEADPIDAYDVFVEWKDVTFARQVTLSTYSIKNGVVCMQDGVLRIWKLADPLKAKDERYVVKTQGGERIVCYLSADGELIEEKPKFTEIVGEGEVE